MHNNTRVRCCALALFLLITLSAIAQAPSRRTRRPPPVKSPEVHEDGRVTFRLRGPEAQHVALNASWYEGPKDLTKSDDGMWTLTIGPLEPKLYNYTYSIDGVRTIDPHNPMLKTGIRTASSLLDVPASPPAFWALRNVPHGEVHIHHYASRATKSTRRVHVYTPPGYDASGDKRYPVLYLLHGAGDDDSTWTSVGRAHFIVDNLIAEGKAEPMLVVMPFGHTVTNESVDRALRNQRFEEDLLGDVIPLVEKRYRVKTDPGSRAIAGLSMGGGQSARVGLSHLDRFHWVALFSAAVGRGGTSPEVAAFLENPKRANESLKLLWIGCGKDDFLIESNQTLVSQLDEKGIRHTWRLTEGDHSWPVWRVYLHELAPQLFRKRES